MTNLIKTTIVSTSILAMLAAPMSAFAQTTPATNYGVRCSLITGRINTKIGVIEAVTPKIDEVQDTIKSAMAGFISGLQVSNPTAASTLTADLNTLSTTYGAPAKADGIKVGGDLTTLQSMANSGQCGTSQGAFAIQLQTTKTDAGKLRTDISAWKGYWQGTVKPYIQSLRNPTPTAGQ